MNTVETSSGREIVGGTSRRGFLEGIGTTAFLLAFQLPVSPGRAGEPSGVHYGEEGAPVVIPTRCVINPGHGPLSRLSKSPAAAA